MQRIRGGTCRHRSLHKPGHFFLIAMLSLWMLNPSARADNRLPGIVGPDDRKPLNTSQWPWSAIGRVNQKGGFAHCTGTLIAKDKVLTAAHCLFDTREKKWLEPEEVVFVPDFRPGYDYDFAKATGFIRGAQSPPEKIDLQFIAHDWAILTLEKPMRQRPVPVRVLEASWVGDVKAIDLASGGYSVDRPYLLSVDYACRIRDLLVDDAVFFTDCDSTKGNSGAPVLFRFASDHWFVVGVFSSATTADAPKMGTYAVGAGLFSEKR